MRIDRLTAADFRNLEGASLEPCGGVNLLYGRNGQGKTSLLEAVWVLSAGSSFRTSRISEAVRFDAAAAQLSMDCESGGRALEVMLTLPKQPQGRSYTVNGVSRRPGDEEARFPVIVFRPEDLELVKAGPAERRTLLDGLGTQLSPRYRKNLNEYGRCLTQRNSLLRGLPGRRLDAQASGVLDVLDVALSRLGVYLVRARRRLLESLVPEAEALYAGVSGAAERLEVRYDCGFGELPEDAREAELLCCERLGQRRQEDLSAGFTTLGAHRDDLVFLLDNRAARAYGSQGQQRTCALACRLASARVLGGLCGEPPVVLLDDVFSELDPARCRYILDTVAECQVFLTGCDLPLLERLAPAGRALRRFLVEAGTVRQEEG